MSNGKGPIHERFALIFLFVGFGLFAFGTFWQAVSPWLSMRHIPYEKMEDLAKDIPPEFAQLARDYPKEFKQYYGEYGEAAFIDALVTAKKSYMGEACWHCHSQYVRPVSKVGTLRQGLLPLRVPERHASASAAGYQTGWI